MHSTFALFVLFKSLKAKNDKKLDMPLRTTYYEYYLPKYTMHIPFAALKFLEHYSQDSSIDLRYRLQGSLIHHPYVHDDISLSVYFASYFKNHHLKNGRTSVRRRTKATCTAHKMQICKMGRDKENLLFFMLGAIT